MNIMMNPGKFLSERLMEAFIKKCGFSASVVSTSSMELMPAIAGACGIDLLACYCNAFFTADSSGLIEDIKRINPAIKVILFLENGIAAQSAATFADETVILPADPDEILNKLKRVLAVVGFQTKETAAAEFAGIGNRSYAPEVGAARTPVFITTADCAAQAAGDITTAPAAAPEVAGNAENPPAVTEDGPEPVVIKESAVPVTDNQPEDAGTTERTLAVFEEQTELTKPCSFPESADSGEDDSNRGKVILADFNGAEPAESITGQSGAPPRLSKRHKKNSKKPKSVMRHLSKTEMLEIMLDQERKLTELKRCVDGLNVRLGEHNEIKEKFG